MKLSSLLNLKLIKCGLAARSKDEAPQEILDVMAAGSPGVTILELEAALAERGAYVLRGRRLVGSVTRGEILKKIAGGK